MSSIPDVTETSEEVWRVCLAYNFHQITAIMPEERAFYTGECYTSSILLKTPLSIVSNQHDLSIGP